MKRKTITAISVVCGLLCSLCVALYLYGVQGSVEQARAEALSRYGGEQLEVVVATRDIYAGETIDASAIETALWVADLLPDQAITSLEDAEGRVASSSILAGEALSEKRFAGESRRLEVPEGMIAVSVPAKDVQAVGGAVSAGSKVDMYATGGTSTDVLASNVLVLATSVSSDDDTGGESISWITIAVSPDAAQGIVAAAQKTELYFTLPGEENLDEANAGEVGSDEKGSDEAGTNEEDVGEVGADETNPSDADSSEAEEQREG